MLRARARHLLARLESSQTRRFCTKDANGPSKGNGNSSSNSERVGSDVSKYHEAYRQLDNLDFMTAAKILFSEPSKKKKFGLDFHLVQLFFACLPSLAVYLVAQYARSEMKRMDAELAERRKREEADKLKEELKAFEEKAKSDPVIKEVKVRLDKLEEAVKEIVVESKKTGSNVSKSKEKSGEKKHPAPNESANPRITPESSKSLQDEQHSKLKSTELEASSGSAKKTGPTPKNQEDSA